MLWWEEMEDICEMEVGREGWRGDFEDLHARLKKFTDVD
jgi:hypothetical protein